MLSLIQEGYPAPLIITVSAVAILVVAGYVWLAPQEELLAKAPPRVKEGYPLLGAFRFFTARWEFFQHSRAQAPSGNFSFFLGKHPVIGLTGDKARKLFFESRELGFAEG
jgi:sterol 14-demethylase